MTDHTPNLKWQDHTVYIHLLPLQRLVTIGTRQHDVKSLAAITKNTDTLLVVDAITSLGVHPLEMDEWGIDCVLTGSQKALMLPPGLGIIALSAKAHEASSNVSTPRFYFNLQAAQKNLKKKTTAVSQHKSPWETLPLQRTLPRWATASFWLRL